jgi:trimeric autotransporter adhesin
LRRIFSFIILLTLAKSLFSQAPQKMSYQAIIRNSSNNLVTSSSIGIRVSILQGSISGTEVYKEIYNPNPQSNANGLVTLEIGTGTPLVGSFTSINWATGPYFIKTEIDPLGGIDFTITGISEILSVPYALFAKTAENISGNITEADPIFTNHVSFGITPAKINDWNSAYSWGNHAGLYSLLEHSHPYLSLTGGEMANTNVITNLNADLLDGQHGSFYAPSSIYPTSGLTTGFVPYKTNTVLANSPIYITGIDNLLISTFKGTNSSGNNIWIGGGGQNSIGSLGKTFLGSENTTVGKEAMLSNTTGYSNTAIGRSSLYSNTIGADNTSIGFISLISNTLGNYNTAIGRGSLSSNTTGSSNTAIGRQSLYSNIIGYGNVAVGSSSMQNNVSGSSNTAVGHESMFSIETAGGNAAIGWKAMYSNKSGYDNIAIGYESLYSATTGVENYAIGRDAIHSMIDGTYNIGIGFATLYNDKHGAYNIAVGMNSLWSANNSLRNIAIGAYSMYNSTTNYENVSIGLFSGRRLTTGSNNTFLGHASGDNASQKIDVINSMALGNGSYTTENNQVVIGNSNVTSIKTSGQIYTTIATGTSPFLIASTTLNTNLNADLLDGQHGSYYQTALTNPLTGTGTIGYIPKFTSTSTMGNSILSESGNILKFGFFELGYDGSNYMDILSYNRANSAYKDIRIRGLNININNTIYSNISSGFVGIGYSSDPTGYSRFAVSGTGYFSGGLNASAYKLSGISTFLDWTRTGHAGVAGQIPVSQGNNITPAWKSLADAGIAPAKGSTHYIQNQNSVAQISSLWINSTAIGQVIGKFGGISEYWSVQNGGNPTSRNILRGVVGSTTNIQFDPIKGGISYINSGNFGIGFSTGTEITNNKLAVNGNIFTNGVITTIGGNSSNWNTAYIWGNHAGLYRPISYVPAWTEITSNPFSFSSASNNQLLKYNSTTLKWENWTPNFLTSYTESDPNFVAWNKTSGIIITASQVSDFNSSVSNNSVVVENSLKNSYPFADAAKLAGIESGAEVNVNADWNAISGDAQILNKPEISVGINPGDMQYWDGTKWVIIAAGQPGQFLQFTALNKPEWITASPIINTIGVTEITKTSATIGGNIISDGGGAIIARGVCWSTTPNPTIADNKTNDENGLGFFTSNISGLTNATTYYVRAYVTNTSFTAYGNELSFISGQ